MTAETIRHILAQPRLSRAVLHFKPLGLHSYAIAQRYIGAPTFATVWRRDDASRSAKWRAESTDGHCWAEDESREGALRELLSHMLERALVLQ